MKKLLTLLAVGSIAFGVVSAAAATLGNIGGGALGASTNTVAACDTDGFDVSYTTAYSGAVDVSTYTVTAVTLGAASEATDEHKVAAGCDTKSFKIALVGADGTTIDETTGSAATGMFTAVLDGTPKVKADSVVRVAVLIQ